MTISPNRDPDEDRGYERQRQAKLDAPISRQQRRAIIRQDRKRLGKLEQHQCGLAHVADAGLLDATLKHAKSQLERYGWPPHDLEVVAAHEAGHLIVALTHGGDFKECYVQQQPGNPDTWVGYNEIFVEGVHGPDFDPKQEPERARKYITQTAGGVAGEIAIERFHAASSPEEAVLIGAVAGAMGDASGGEGILRAAIKLLQRNRAAFDAARALLEAKHRITHDDIPGILALMSNTESKEAHRG